MAAKYIGQLLTGAILTRENIMKRLPLLAVAALLAMIYMYIGFSVQARHSEVDKLTKEITKLRTISVTTSAVRQEATGRENIEKLLKKHGIEVEQGDTMPQLIAR